MYLALYQTKLNWPMLKPSWARLIDWLKELKQENSEPWFHCASGNVFSGEEQIKHLEFFFTCVTRSMFSGSWFSRAPPQSTVILLALQRHCKCEENELFLMSICNWLPTWQNCGHKALAGAASVAKVRKTKALVLNKARKNLERKTTSLVIITTTQHHEEWILSLRSCLYSTSFSRKFSLPFFRWVCFT